MNPITILLLAGAVVLGVWFLLTKGLKSGDKPAPAPAEDKIPVEETSATLEAPAHTAENLPVAGSAEVAQPKAKKPKAEKVVKVKPAKETKAKKPGRPKKGKDGLLLS